MKSMLSLAAAVSTAAFLTWSTPAFAQPTGSHQLGNQSPSGFRAGPGAASNPITPEPKIKRPNTKSCVVTLISNYSFSDFTPATGSYAAPPASQCPGPWSKVVLDWTVGVSGVQYDRLGAIWLDGTEIFHFTTSEPPGSAISWHVEKDVTEYAQTFTSASTYTVSLGNLVTKSLTGIYVATATLTFYEPGPHWPAAVTPDLVASISAAPSSPPWFTLNTPSNQASATLSLPTNIESAELEVYTTGHGCDEFWYANESTAYEQSINPSDTCGGTAYRELDVTIDGMLAGVIVPYPYIYTGGINPSFWIPIPGHDTLSIPPYRVNLSPFAGILTNGQPHTIAINVVNNTSYWVCDADLLVTEDHGSATTSGALTSLHSGPSVVEHYNESHLNSAGGTAEYRAKHWVDARGYIDTSHGRVTSEVAQQWQYADHQNFANSGSFYFYNANTAGTTTETTVRRGGRTRTTTTLSYPLEIHKPSGKPLQIDQAWYETRSTQAPHGSSLAYTQDVIRASAVGGVHSSEHYIQQDSSGYCYDRLFTEAARVLTGDQHLPCK